jgi:FlaA1/EpsC-like NDP-sugar epimerase
MVGTEKRSKAPHTCKGGDVSMRLLVTGGAGYIGSVVSSQLVEECHEVMVLGNLS